MQLQWAHWPSVNGGPWHAGCVTPDTTEWLLRERGDMLTYRRLSREYIHSTVGTLSTPSPEGRRGDIPDAVEFDERVAAAPWEARESGLPRPSRSTRPAQGAAMTKRTR